MKMFPKTQDHAIDRLLRARGGSPSDKSSQACRTFDPDLANAYVERSLTANETARYEQHLAVCSPCRKAIIVLTRMAAADLETAQPDKVAAVAQIPGESRWRRLLGTLTVPQWAMAATAVIALAVAAPLILSHHSTPSTPNERIVAGGSAASSTTPEQPVSAGTAQAQTSSEPVASTSPAAASREPNPSNPTPAPNAEKTVAVADAKKETSGAAATAAAGAGATEAPAAATQPVETKPVADETVAKSSDQPQPTPPATQPAPSEAPLPKIDASKAKQLPSDKDMATATTIKPGQTDGAERGKTTTAVQAEAIAPPPVRGPRDEASHRDSRNRVAAGGASAFRDSAEAAPAPRGEPRKVANHVFFLRGDVWTDKDYNPHKEGSVVTLIRDSEVFNGVVAKDEKLKRLLTSFNTHEQFLVVYKGLAYMVKPQNSSP
jgi:hypothetical protein